MKSQVFDFKRVYIFVAKTTKSGIREKSIGCRATPPVNAYRALCSFHPVDGPEKVVFYLSDEMFAIRAPILVSIDAQSTAILKIELASDR